MKDYIDNGLNHIKKLKELFPNIKIENTFNINYHKRILINLEIEEKEYLKIMILNGLYPWSLLINRMINDEKKYKMIHKLIDVWEKMPISSLLSSNCAYCIKYRNSFNLHNCGNCPLSKIGENCLKENSIWYKWYRARSKTHRIKYAKMMLEAIKKS